MKGMCMRQNKHLYVREQKDTAYYETLGRILRLGSHGFPSRFDCSFTILYTIMQKQPTPLDRIIAASQRIQTKCEGIRVSRPLRLKGCLPSLDIPPIKALLSRSLSTTLNDVQRTGLTQAVVRVIRKFGDTALMNFRSTVQRLQSVEELGGLSGPVIEQRLCSLFEAQFHRHNEAIRALLEKAVSEYAVEPVGESSKKGNGFGPVRVYPIVPSPRTRPSS